MSDRPTHQGPPYPPIRRVGQPDGGDGHVADLTALYALGALEPQERARVERHVGACPACAQALADDQRAAGLLPFLAPPALPGPDVKVTLFARIAQAQRAVPARAFGRHLPPSFTIPASTPRPDPTPERRPHRWSRPHLRLARRQRGWAIALPLATMPLLLALALTGLWGLRLRDKVDARDDQMAQLQAQISNLGGFVVGAESFQMEAGPGATDATGRIVVGDDKKAATLVVQLDEPTLSRAYDVYVNKGGTLVPAGEVRVDEKGFGMATIPLDEPFANYTSVEVEAKPLLTDGTDLHEPDTGGGILAWRQQEEQPSIGDTSIEPSP